MRLVFIRFTITLKYLHRQIKTNCVLTWRKTSLLMRCTKDECLTVFDHYVVDIEVYAKQVELKRFSVKNSKKLIFNRVGYLCLFT